MSISDACSVCEEEGEELQDNERRGFNDYKLEQDMQIDDDKRLRVTGALEYLRQQRWAWADKFFESKEMQIDDIKGLKATGKALGYLIQQTWADKFLEPKDLQIDDVNGLKVTEYALEYLRRERYRLFTRRRLPSGEVDILMFANPNSLQLLKLFPYVIGIDDTYKTKRYGMSLVEMVGISSDFKTFKIALAFIKEENTPDYLFIMQRLKKMYIDLGVKPTAIVTNRDNALISAIGQVFGDTVKHLLCWVHIKKKIKVYARSVIKKNKDRVEAFADKCWELFSSETEETYLERLQELRDGWHIDLVRYMEMTWLNPYKENIIRAWTDNHLHFFNANTKRLKGIPVNLKHDLESTLYDFNSIVRTIHCSLESQCESVRISMEWSRSKLPTKVFLLGPFIKPLFAPLFNKVTLECLRILLDMYYDIRNGKMTSDCNHEWWRTCNGLPCIHRINMAMLHNTPIKPSEIHRFWRQVEWKGTKNGGPMHQVSCGQMEEDYVYEDASLQADLKQSNQSSLKESKNIVLKGKSKGAYDNKYTIKRDPSLFKHSMKTRGSKTHVEVSGGSECQIQEANKVTHVPTFDVKHWGITFPAESMDYFMFSFIINATKVTADGNCGYRSLALQLGLHEDDYVKVRMDIGSELVENKEIYMRMTPVIADYDILVENVNYFISPCPERYQMEMPIVGLAFATRFQVALVHLDWNGPCLCLPLKASFNNNKPPEKIMSIALFQGHFIPLWLSDIAPLPPPSNYWHKFKHPSVNAWDNFYKDRIAKWCSYRKGAGRSHEPLV